MKHSKIYRTLPLGIDGFETIAVYLAPLLLERQMTQSRLFQILSVSTVLTLTACTAEPADTERGQASTSAEEVQASTDGTVVHMLPLHSSQNLSSNLPSSAGAPNPAACAHTVTNFGGPTLKNVDVHPVFWRSTTALQANLNAFYPAIVGGSPLWMVLAQYGIGNGTAVAGIVDADSANTVSDVSIHTELNRLFTAGNLPAPNANRYYPVHFPSGVVVTAPDGSRSCVQFCAYHGTYVRNGVNVNYGVIPDIGSGGCQNGCGGSTVTNNTDSVASHELVEAVTDPAVGLATVFGPPLGWYDQADNAELGDLCNGQQGTTAGFTVQKVWSNAACACVDH